MLNKNQEIEIDIRKYEYDLVNGKLALNIARLDKLWISLVGSLLIGVATALKSNSTGVMFTLMPICFAIWLTLFLYILSQIERQKLCALTQAIEINTILGKQVFIYDTQIMNKIWRYNKERPSRYILLLNLVLVMPVCSMFVFSLIKGVVYIGENFGTNWSFMYAFVTFFILVAGIVSFLWARKNKYIPDLSHNPS